MGSLFDDKEKRMDEVAMKVEERLQALEITMDSMLWGPPDPAYRRDVAASLYTKLEAAEQTQPLPPAVRVLLYGIADGLAGIDNTPDSLKPSLRWLVQSRESGDR